MEARGRMSKGIYEQDNGLEIWKRSDGLFVAIYPNHRWRSRSIVQLSKRLRQRWIISYDTMVELREKYGRREAEEK